MTKYLILGLILSLFLVFYFLFVGVPTEQTARAWWKKIGLPLATSILFFILGVKIYFSPIAGIFLAVFGWKAPALYRQQQNRKFRLHLKSITNDFFSVASSMFGANMTPPKVIATCAERLPDPLATDFKNLLGSHTFDDKPIPDGIIETGEKYQLAELQAAGYIIERSSSYGGSKAASEGLLHLQKAISNLGKRLTERTKQIHEALTSARLILYVNLLGLLLNALIPALRAIHQQNSLPISIGIGMTMVYYLLIQKNSQSKDLEEY
ncbi:hypothetical protein V6C32_10825 [Desulforamulus ruminis]|uniref:hypothetical protein n=1 Tax=Desulforamulus ruminis TaxID=1564 RepID=UPI002FD9E2DC